MARRARQSRAFSVTVQCQDGTSDQEYLLSAQSNVTVQWVCFQREVAPRTGREHLQAYVYLTRKSTLASVIALEVFGHSCHTEIRQGSHKQLKEYCTKEDTRMDGHQPMMSGVEPQQGNRQTVRDVVAAVKANPFCSFLELAEETPAVARMVSFVKEVRVRLAFDVCNL